MGATTTPAPPPKTGDADGAQTAEQLALPPGFIPGAQANGFGQQYAGMPLQLPPGVQVKQQRGPQFWVPTTILGMLVVAGIGVGGYFIGESSRPSDAQIAGKVTAGATHQKAVDATARATALTNQRAELRRVFVRRGRRLAKKSYKKGFTDG